MLQSYFSYIRKYSHLCKDNFQHQILNELLPNRLIQFKVDIFEMYINNYRQNTYEIKQETSNN